MQDFRCSPNFYLSASLDTNRFFQYKSVTVVNCLYTALLYRILLHILLPLIYYLPILLSWHTILLSILSYYPYYLTTLLSAVRLSYWLRQDVRNIKLFRISSLRCDFSRIKYKRATEESSGNSLLCFYFWLSIIQHLTEGKKKCERNRKREGKFLESVISQCKGDSSLLVVILLVINPPVRW